MVEFVHNKFLGQLLGQVTLRYFENTEFTLNIIDTSAIRLLGLRDWRTLRVRISSLSGVVLKIIVGGACEIVFDAKMLDKNISINVVIKGFAIAALNIAKEKGNSRK